METGAGAVLDAEREETHALFRAGRTSSSKTALLLIGSLLLFGLVALPNRSVVDVLVVTAVVLFHEFGHWTAMRLSGYQDTSIFFIPFLGAATSGRSVDGSPWKEGLVLLAGPLPGLLLAIPVLVLGTAQHHEGLIRAGYTLLGLNAFNLLPLVPLDGGRVFELVLFRRHPMLESGFRFCAAAGLGALGLRLHEFVLLALAVLMLMALPALHRVRGVRESLRERVSPDLPPAGLSQGEVEALYDGARKLVVGFAGKDMPVKPSNVARMMLQLQDGLRMRVPGWRISLALMGGWVAGAVLVAAGAIAIVVTRRLSG